MESRRRVGLQPREKKMIIIIEHSKCLPKKPTNNVDLLFCLPTNYSNWTVTRTTQIRKGHGGLKGRMNCDNHQLRLTGHAEHALTLLLLQQQSKESIAHANSLTHPHTHTHTHTHTRTHWDGGYWSVLPAAELCWLKELRAHRRQSE